MRLLLHEQAYEIPLAAGRLVYEQEGQPTGAVESWRLTEAVDGYHFLRVDLDGRAAASGRSFLFHLTISPQGRAERLLFQAYGPDGLVKGTVLFEEHSLVVGRQLDGQARQEEQMIAPWFWFPATLGLSLLAGLPGDGQVEAVMLDAAAQFAPRLVTLTHQWGQPETVTVMGKEWLTRPLTLTWADQSRTIWLNHHQHPLFMQRQDGLCGRETRYIVVGENYDLSRSDK